MPVLTTIVVPAEVIKLILLHDIKGDYIDTVEVNDFPAEYVTKEYKTFVRMRVVNEVMDWVKSRDIMKVAIRESYKQRA